MNANDQGGTVNRNDVTAAMEPVMADVGEQIQILDSHAGEFARMILEHNLAGGPRPITPRGMHPRIASAVKDIALEEVTATRLFGRHQRAQRFIEDLAR